MERTKNIHSPWRYDIWMVTPIRSCVSSLEEDDIRRLEKIRGIAHNLDFSRNSHKQKNVCIFDLCEIFVLSYVFWTKWFNRKSNKIPFVLFQSLKWFKWGLVAEKAEKSHGKQIFFLQCNCSLLFHLELMNFHWTS